MLYNNKLRIEDGAGGLFCVCVGRLVAEQRQTATWTFNHHPPNEEGAALATYERSVSSDSDIAEYRPRGAFM